VVDAEVTDSKGEPIASEADRVKAAGAQPNPQYAGQAPCPTCKTPSNPWKYHKPGKTPETHFCKPCGKPFQAAAVAA
jgi:hypothetical protein